MSAFHGAGEEAAVPCQSVAWECGMGVSVACLLDQPEPGKDKPSIGSKEVTESMYNYDLEEPMSQRNNCRKLLPTALPEA